MKWEFVVEILLEEVDGNVNDEDFFRFIVVDFFVVRYEFIRRILRESSRFKVLEDGGINVEVKEISNEGRMEGLKVKKEFF